MKKIKTKESICFGCRLISAVDCSRGTVLEIIEQELGHKENWSLVRKKILNAFGDRGLSQKIREILEDEFGEFCNE